MVKYIDATAVWYDGQRNKYDPGFLGIRLSFVVQILTLEDAHKIVKQRTLRAMMLFGHDVHRSSSLSIAHYLRYIMA